MKSLAGLIETWGVGSYKISNLNIGTATQNTSEGSKTTENRQIYGHGQIYLTGLVTPKQSH